MSLFSAIKNAYNSVDKKLGGVLPGGVPRTSSSSTQTSTSSSSSTSSGSTSGGGGSFGGSATTSNVPAQKADSVIVTDTSQGSVTTSINQKGEITGRKVEYVEGTNPDDIVNASSRQGGLVQQTQQQAITTSQAQPNYLQPAPSTRERALRELKYYGPVNTLTLESGSLGRRYIGGALNINNPSGYQSRGLRNFGYIAGSTLPYIGPQAPALLVAKGGEDILYPGGGGFKQGLFEIGLGGVGLYSQVRIAKAPKSVGLAEDSIITFSAQTASETAGYKEVRTILGFESTTGKSAGYVEGITTPKPSGGYSTRFIGSVGEPGANIETGKAIIGASKGISKGTTGQRILYEGRGLTAYDEIKASYFAGSGASGSPTTNLRIPGGLTNTYKDISDFSSGGVSIGNQRVQLSAGRSTSSFGNVNYAGFNFRINRPTNSINFIPSESPLTFTNPSNTFYETSLKQTQEYAANLNAQFARPSTSPSFNSVTQLSKPSVVAAANLKTETITSPISTRQTSTRSQDYSFSSSSIALTRPRTSLTSDTTSSKSATAAISATASALVSGQNFRSSFSESQNIGFVSGGVSRTGLIQRQSFGFGSPGFNLGPISPRVNSSFVPPPVFSFGGLNNIISSRVVRGGRSPRRYTPSFNAIIFNLRGSFKGGKALRKSGLNFRPITSGFKFNTGLNGFRVPAL